jgi:pimeloyl-ACP methyl ester carboxylesterase
MIKGITMMNHNFQQQQVTLNGLSFNLVCAGKADAPLIVLLHGFPECWLTWKDQIQPLVDAGYRVIAPDQRGYNLTDKPKSLDDYRIDILASDVEAIREYAGCDTFHLVGHDWGAAVAWWYGMHYSDKLRSLTVINVPHPTVFKQTLKTNKRQLLKSWYMFFFQIPKLPEALMPLWNFKQLQKGLVESSNTGTFDDEILSQLTTVWKQPGAITGMLNWYRAALRRPVEASNLNVACPTRILWGENDIALTKEMAQLSTQYCEDVELTYYPDGSHWLTHDHPKRVAAEIIRFCDAH